MAEVSVGSLPSLSARMFCSGKRFVISPSIRKCKRMCTRVCVLAMCAMGGGLHGPNLRVTSTGSGQELGANL